MFKRKISSIFLIFILFFNLSFLCILPPNISAFSITSWNQHKEHEEVEGFVFKLDFHSWWNRSYLEWNEFIMGDMIDFCTVTLLRKNPNDLEAKPIKIIINSPSNIQYESYFKKGGGEDFYYAGKFSQSSDEIIVKLNESGIWSVDIIFNESYNIEWIYTGSEEFQNNSEFHIFYGSLVNVYTNLEYQQLKASKALEESAKASKEQSDQTKLSTFALFIAAIVAIIHIFVLIGVEYFHYQKKDNNIESEQENNREENRGDKKMISEKLNQVHEEVLNSLKKTQPIIVLISLSIVIAGLSQFIKLDISITSIGAAICFFISLISSFIKSFTKTNNLYVMTFFLAGLISGFGFLLGVIFVIIVAVWTVLMAINLVVLIALGSALFIITYTSFNFYDSIKKARENVSNKKYFLSIAALILLIVGTLMYILNHISLIYDLSFNLGYSNIFLNLILAGWLIIALGGICCIIAYKVK